jgi:hypothetical protein
MSAKPPRGLAGLSAEFPARKYFHFADEGDPNTAIDRKNVRKALTIPAEYIHAPPSLE